MAVLYKSATRVSSYQKNQTRFWCSTIASESWISRSLIHTGTSKPLIIFQSSSLCFIMK